MTGDEDPGYIKSIRMRDNTTGEERTLTGKNVELDWLGDYIWTDGNFGCDCNRGLFWSDWKGDEEFGCGDERFTIFDITLQDGRVIKIDAVAKV